MKRWLRLLLIAAPVIVLMLGVPAGVALARRSPPREPAALLPRVETVVANGTVGPRSRPPITGPQRTLGPPLPVSQAQSGVIGTITRVTPDRFVVYTRAKKVAFVTIDPKTTIRMNGKNIKAADVQRGDRVTILGHRDSTGVFHAQLIRVVRPPRPDPASGAPR